ncbi:MAG TPA: ComEC/Rec2 family competence protein [Flavobacteriales bacterium]|nr:ComEC/Rec2 family competence protein [Flavobacteriales bacterium]HIO16175.1 ComEC/Rec2 family competence protein [Flavobacteriales bacterium]
MRTHAPLLPYTIALWLGCTFGLNGVTALSYVFYTWLILGCWIAFGWKYSFTSLRMLLFLVCGFIGFGRSCFEIHNRPYPDGGVHLMTITSCKPLAVSHGENIYGYGKTEEVGKVAFIWPKQIKFPSSKLRALGKWEEFPPPSKYRSFDFRKYYESLGCRGVFKPAYTSEKALQLPKTFPELFRSKMASIIERAEVETPADGFLMGLSTGDKSMINREMKDLFANAGLAHLLAVSGYHVGLVGFIPLLLLRSRRREIRWIAMIGLMLIWAFIIACGSPWSAVRAGIMISVGCLSRWFGRSILPWQSLALAAWVVVWIDPWAPQQLGTQLSFAATAGILAVVSSPKWLILRIPIAAQSATMAWAASAFNQLPILFLPLNVLASLVVTLVGVLLGLGAGLSGVYPSLSNELVMIGGNVVNQCLVYLQRINDVIPLAYEIKSSQMYIVASVAVWGWLLSSTIPQMLARIISATAVAFVTLNLLDLLVNL